MKSIYLILAFISFSLSVYCSTQLPDKLIYKDSTFSLETNPLESYFVEHPDKRPMLGIGSKASCLLRAYVGTFCITNNRLFVKDIEYLDLVMDSRNRDSLILKSAMNTVFPNQALFPCDWYTGYLILSYGKMIERVHMSYASIYEKYFVIKIVKGEIVSEQKMTSDDYKKFKESQFELFKKTDEYKLILERIKKEGKSVKENEDRLKMFPPIYTSKLYN